MMSPYASAEELAEMHDKAWLAQEVVRLRQALSHANNRWERLRAAVRTAYVLTD